MTTGTFIVVEGIDGSGSTSIALGIGSHFRAAGRGVHTTCEPSSGPIGNMIRQVLAHRLVVPGDGAHAAFDWGTMALLFAADRLDHLQAEIVPHLERGDLVISDRYDLSSLAYQSATARKEGAAGDAGAASAVAWIRELNRQARRPDLTLVLDVHADVAAERRKIRGGKPELYEGLELQRRLASLYAESEKLVPGDRIVHIDANARFDDVLAASITAVERL
jgi:dTMP kinase